MNSEVAKNGRDSVPGTVLLVLGMHRSGTSCLTGSLQQAGLALGEFSEWNAHNLKGNRENDQVTLLNERVLNANGGSWDAPPGRVEWSTAHKVAARQILAKHAHHGLWGFKDPRTLFTLEGWLELIEPGYVGIFRHPAAVASSLTARRDIALGWSEALELWHRYNRRLLQYHERFEFPLLCFDWPEPLFHAALGRVKESFGLAPVPESDRFYAPDLIHHYDVGERPIPIEMEQLYFRLRAISDDQA